MKKPTEHLTYANVISTLCLFLLLGGGAAVAASNLSKNSVGPKQLKKNAVTAVKIKDGAVSTAKLGAGAVTEAKLGDGAVTGAKLADGAVNGAKVADGSLTGADINQATLTGVKASNVYALSFQSGSDFCQPSLQLPSGFSSEAGSEGFCKVTAPFSLATCVSTASSAIRGVADNFVTLKGSRSVQIIQHTSSPNALTVEMNFNGERSNLAFDLVLVC